MKAPGLKTGCGRTALSRIVPKLPSLQRFLSCRWSRRPLQYRPIPPSWVANRVANDRIMFSSPIATLPPGTLARAPSGPYSGPYSGERASVGRWPIERGPAQSCPLHSLVSLMSETEVAVHWGCGPGQFAYLGCCLPVGAAISPQPNTHPYCVSHWRRPATHIIICPSVRHHLLSRGCMPCIAGSPDSFPNSCQSR